MKNEPGNEPSEPTFESPGAMLDHLAAHPEWSDAQRERFLGRLVERFPAGTIVAGLRGRIHHLGAPDFEAVLRLIEAFPDPSLLAELAARLDEQTDLAPERAWEVLAILENAAMLEEAPGLAERWDEINEVLDGDDPIAQLVDELEGDPEGLWLALQGLEAIEPDIRLDIVQGLADHAEGPGVIEFLRLLAYAHDPPTRAAALAVLASTDAGRPEVDAAWRDIAAHHTDAAVMDLARRQIRPSGARLPARTGPGGLARRPPRLSRSLITAVDGLGRGTIVLGARCDSGIATAAFGCDLEHGVREVLGDMAGDAAAAVAAFEELTGHITADVVEDAHDLALGLLAGSLTLTRTSAPAALRFWVEATAGRGFQAFPFPASFPGWDPADLPFDEMSDRASDVLDACPDWIDTSPLTFEIAREIRLREGLSAPDPKRDAGAYRYLFEHGLGGQLERYRRMLLWMAWFWRASGREERARSALALAIQLSDAQHVVPGHPFTVALTTRSLAAAQERLGRE